MIDHIDEGIMQIEVVVPGTLALQFDVRGAEDPKSMERFLDAFDGAEVEVESGGARAQYMPTSSCFLVDRDLYTIVH